MFDDVYKRDQEVWNACAETYEEQIVGGHPDVTAYEAFEEDLLDRFLLYLIRDCKQHVYLFDVGCGSARLHFRYGLKTVHDQIVQPDMKEKIRYARSKNHGCHYDPILAEGMYGVGGIDFSAKMIEMAKQKLINAGLGGSIGDFLSFQEGSAFELEPMPVGPLPLAVAVCNSVGVMQGPIGAVKLFKSMFQAVEQSGGIAIISGYCAEAIESFALGNYESTMNVCGQPRWLKSNEYSSSSHILVPHAYKRAHDSDSTIVADVFDLDGHLVEKGYLFERDPAEVRKTIEDGHIRTHTDYESYWYSYEQFEQWIALHWPKGETYHLLGKNIDPLRAEPVQLAVLDMGGHLKTLLARWLKTI